MGVHGTYVLICNIFLRYTTMQNFRLNFDAKMDVT